MGGAKEERRRARECGCEGNGVEWIVVEERGEERRGEERRREREEGIRDWYEICWDMGMEN